MSSTGSSSTSAEAHRGVDEDEDFFQEVEGRRPRRPDRVDDPREGQRRRRCNLLEDLLDF